MWGSIGSCGAAADRERRGGGGRTGFYLVYALCTGRTHVPRKLHRNAFKCHGYLELFLARNPSLEVPPRLDTHPSFIGLHTH
jgi:hypothetical protein